ncbi:MAG: hypothetical protein GF411_10700 [Candidatus Lokiarchaeota archaeon]|nr:hypothetical protein [Candidatus Lokiarchaeota archaeon]
MKSINEIRVRRYTEESNHDEKGLIASEQIVEIRTSERQLGVLKTSPGLEEYLALGFILSMGYWPYSNKYPEVIRQEEYVLVIIDEASIEDHIRDRDDIFPLESELFLRLEDFQKQLGYISEQAELSSETTGIHSALLIDTLEHKQYFAEDFSQSAAVDKVIGMGLANGIHFPASYLLVTDLITQDIAEKCIWVEIPLIASSSSSTDRGILTAETFNITLIGNLTVDSFSVYHEGAVKIE